MLVQAYLLSIKQICISEVKTKRNSNTNKANLLLFVSYFFCLFVYYYKLQLLVNKS